MHKSLKSKTIKKYTYIHTKKHPQTYIPITVGDRTTGPLFNPMQWVGSELSDFLLTWSSNLSDCTLTGGSKLLDCNLTEGSKLLDFPLTGS